MRLELNDGRGGRYRAARRVAVTAGVAWGIGGIGGMGGTGLGVAMADVGRVRAVAVAGGSAGPGLEYGRFADAIINDEGRVLFRADVALRVLANDECAGATELSKGVTLVSTHGATDSPTNTGCDGYGDAWFKYTADVAGDVKFSMYGADFPVKFTMFRGQCGALQPLGCALDRRTMAAGETIYIRVGSWPPVVHGTVCIAIEPLMGSNVRFSPRWVDQAIFSDRSGQMEILLRRGDTTGFDPERFHTGIESPVFRNSGRFALMGGVTGFPAVAWQSTPTAAMIAENGGGEVSLIDIEVAPKPPAFPDWFLPPPRMMEEGLVAYSSLDGAWVRYGEAIMGTGEQAPGFGKGVTVRRFEQPVVASSGGVVFRSGLAGEGFDDASAALWVDPDADGAAPVEVIAYTGMPAPGVNGATFASFAMEPAINAAGTVVFWASLVGEGVDETNNSGIWAMRGGELSLLLRTGGAAPEIENGSVVQTLSRRPALNEQGEAAVMGYVTGGEVTPLSNSVIWTVAANGQARMVVREGDAAPTGAGVMYASFSDPVLNDRGDVAFHAHLRGDDVSKTNSSTIVLAPSTGRAVKIARTGDMLAVSGNEDRRVTDLTFGTDRPSSGRGQLNNGGQIVFQALFADSTSAVYVGGAYCLADINLDGVVTSGDFFDFLTAFFDGRALADINESGQIDSSDFFNFLTVFFAGC